MKKICAVLLAFTLLFSAGCRLNGSLKSLNYSMVSGSFSNGYYSVAEDKNNIYYTTDEGLMKADKKLSVPDLIKKGENISGLSVYNGRLYYLDYADDGLSFIKSINLNGQDEKVVWNQYADGPDDNKAVNGFRIYDGQFYLYDSDTSVMKFDPKTKKLEKFLDDVDCWDIHNGYVYYTDYNGKTYTIYRRNLETGKVEIVRGKGVLRQKGEIEIYDFVFLNNDLYYTASNDGDDERDYIYKYNPNGKDVEFDDTTDKYFDFITQYGGRLYYVISDDDSDKSELYRYDPSTRATVLIGNISGFDSSYGLQIVNGCAFYDVDKDDKNVKARWIPVNK